MNKEWTDKLVKAFLVLCGLMTVGIVLYNALNTPQNAAPSIRYYSETYLAGQENPPGSEGVYEPGDWGKDPDAGEDDAAGSTGSNQTAAENPGKSAYGQSKGTATSSKKTSSRKTAANKNSSRKTSSKKTASKNAGGSGTGSRPTSSVFFGPFNINTVTYEQLLTIDGIGDVTARNILEFRENCGGFDNMEQLLNVPGVGEARLKKLIESCYAAPAG